MISSSVTQTDGGGPWAGRLSEGGTPGGGFVPARRGPRPPSRRAAWTAPIWIRL